MKATQQVNRRSVLWVCAGLAVALFLYIYLPCGLSMLWNYYWWIGYAGTVRLAQPAPATLPDTLPVPKVLHQTWRDNKLPEKWKAAQKSCIDAHPGYEYRLWTDSDAEQLIREKFPWFLETYRAYPHNIQRADVLRYFVLYEYGGIYLDLDVECMKSLDSYRDANFTAPKTYPIGVSNDVMIARPKDPFSLQLIQNLKHWKKWFFVRYATVMFSTGPMYVTIQYSLYKQKQDFTVLPAKVYGKYEKSDQAYLKHLHGSSWHGNDARYIFWLEHYGLQFAAVAALLLATALTTLILHRRYAAAGKGGIPQALQAWMAHRCCHCHCGDKHEKPEKQQHAHPHPPSQELTAVTAHITGTNRHTAMTPAHSSSNLRSTLQGRSGLQRAAGDSKGALDGKVVDL